MSDLRGFGRRMRETGRRVEENSSALVRRVALAVDSTVVLATPVDTGRARANWQVNIGSPAAGTRDAYATGSQGSTASANAREALAQGRDEISRYRPGDDSINITNNLPYIGRLNDGHSAQAPSGFVERAVLVGVNAANSARILVNDGRPLGDPGAVE